MLLQDILNRVDTHLLHYTMGAYQNIVQSHEAAIYALLTVYIITLGYRLMLGKTTMTLSFFTQHALTLAVCVLLATNWAWFSTLVYDFATNAPAGIAVAMAQAVPGIPTGTSGIELLNYFWQVGMAVASQVFEGAGRFGFGQMGMALMIMLLTLLATLGGFVFILLAKIMLAVTLALSPVFILLFIFESTRPLFNGWLRGVTTAMLIPLFIYSVIGLMYAVMFDYANQIMTGDGIDARDIFTLMCVFGISLVTYLSAGSMAASIASGLQVSLQPAAAAGMGLLRRGFDKKNRSAANQAIYAQGLNARPASPAYASHHASAARGWRKPKVAV